MDIIPANGGKGFGVKKVLHYVPFTKEEAIAFGDDTNDIEMLQDLLMVAANEALRQMEEISQNEMSKLTGSLGIPGL